MQILEYQSICLRNLITYKTECGWDQLPSLIVFTYENLETLGAELAGRAIITAEGCGTQELEILVPIQKPLPSRNEYQFKPLFHLMNAVSVRHEGNFSQICRTEQRLREYLAAHDYEAVTQPYYQVVRISEGSCIVDIFVGIHDSPIEC